MCTNPWKPASTRPARVNSMDRPYGRGASRNMTMGPMRRTSARRLNPGPRGSPAVASESDRAALRGPASQRRDGSMRRGGGVSIIGVLYLLIGVAVAGFRGYLVDWTVPGNILEGILAILV